MATRQKKTKIFQRRRREKKKHVDTSLSHRQDLFAAAAQCRIYRFSPSFYIPKSFFSEFISLCVRARVRSRLGNNSRLALDAWNPPIQVTFFILFSQNREFSVHSKRKVKAFLLLTHIPQISSVNLHVNIYLA